MDYLQNQFDRAKFSGSSNKSLRVSETSLNYARQSPISWFGFSSEKGFPDASLKDFY